MRDRSAVMPTDQDREFELVLGNKQLFSLLFLVFVLLGVFFAMGYAMGRTSAPAEIAQTPQPARTDGVAGSAVRPTATQGSAMPPTIPASETARPALETAVAQPAPAAPESAPPAVDSSVPRLIEPKLGQVFLQVSAVARPEAELLVEVLSRKGFRAVMAPGPSDKVIRVLVGPASSDSELAKLRTTLEESGFKAMVRRY